MTSEQCKGSFCEAFCSGIKLIESQTNDEFNNKLYYANVISLMEKYLSDIFIHEISSSREAIVRLSTQNKFRSESLKIPYLLHHTVEDFLINSMKNTVWHRLNDIDVLFKNVMDINMNISTELTEIIKIRHHIIHRNGYDPEGNKIVITDQDLQKCIARVSAFIFETDKQYQEKK
ncbi:MAG: hypothetical protein OXC48_02570 [Endozoicomonadaceae bacterium]|nr:hypothetical protein [Endozoicomonadaceae bacterium]